MSQKTAAAYHGYITEAKKLERIVVVGPMKKAKIVMGLMHEDGWHITRSGPFIDGAELDGARFLFIAEREIADTQ